MSDPENQNQNEEEYEEEMMNLNQNENENQEDEETQDVYAFDIQINEDSYLLVIGKTEENKILLRLVDKEDQNKPFFQNEFSLEDLRHINGIFSNIDDEDIAFQYLVSNLNEADKEIKIIDESKITFIIYIMDEDERIKIDFDLFKSMDEALNENENGNENDEDIMEEAADIINDVIDNNNKNDNKINFEKEENEEKEEKEEKEENLSKKLGLGGVHDNKNIEKKEDKNENTNPDHKIDDLKVVTPKEEQKNIVNNDAKLMKEELLNIINTMNETLENKILIQNESFNKIKGDIIKESEGKINELKEEINKKDNEIASLKNTITNLEQKLNSYEGKIDNMNNKFINLENLNNNLSNNKDDSGNQMNEIIVNEMKDNIINMENKINELKIEHETHKNNNDDNFNILNEKISNIENKILLNNKNYQTEEKAEDNKKIIDLENNLRNLENKIKDYEFDQLIENIAILTEKQNDTKLYEAISNMDSELNAIKEKINKQEKELTRGSFSKNEKTNNDTEIINRINNQENVILTLQNKIQTIQEEKNASNITNSNIEKTLSEINNAINDLSSKIDLLFTTTKQLSKENSELNTKYNNIKSDISKVSSKISNTPKISHQENIISRGNNYRQNDNLMQYNQNDYYNKTTPSLTTPKNTFNSNIVNLEDILFIINRLKEIHPKLHNINLNLVYRASEDGDKAADFHEKCDKIGPNIVIIKTRKGNIFGGFTFKNWEHMPRDIDEKRPNLGSASRDSKAFGFNVNHQKIYSNEKPNEFAIWCNKNYGPTFKNNLFQIFDSCMKKGGYCSVRNNSHFGGQMFDFEIAGGESRFRVEELEVFEIRTK